MCFFSRFRRQKVWIFVFKQKTAYEMRISDWSSDVCSSDRIGDGADVGRRIGEAKRHHGRHHREPGQPKPRAALAEAGGENGDVDPEIGRASCRARVWQYV